MRKLVSSTLVSLDGIVSNQAEWASGFFDTEAKEHARASLAECDLFLIGRKAYEQFAPAWSRIKGDPYFDAVNAARKIVVSNSLPSAAWNAEVLRGDAAQGIRRLKEQPGKDIMKYGVTALDRTLFEHRLVDEYRLMIFPVVIGSGTRLFEGIDTRRMRLELTSTQHFASGVVQVAYRPKWL